MKFIITFLWSFFLVTLLNYVVSSVNGVEFNFALGAMLSVLVSVLILVISNIIPDEPAAHEHH